VLEEAHAASSLGSAAHRLVVLGVCELTERRRGQQEGLRSKVPFGPVSADPKRPGGEGMHCKTRGRGKPSRARLTTSHPGDGAIAAARAHLVLDVERARAAATAQSVRLRAFTKSSKSIATIPVAEALHLQSDSRRMA
jgi:hypothetical protein